MADDDIFEPINALSEEEEHLWQPAGSAARPAWIRARPSRAPPRSVENYQQ